jgi:NACHT domain
MKNMTATRQRRSTASKNLGDDYRDVIGLQYLVRMLRDPSSVLWVSFESDEAGSLDDVCVQLPDRVEYVQAKYTVEESEWSLENLFEIKTSKSRSLLQKWAISWNQIRNLGQPYSIIVRTRRQPDSEFTKLLDGNRFKQTRQRIVGTARASIVQHLSSLGLTDEDVSNFLSDLQFDFENIDVELLISQVKADFISLGASENNWNALQAELRQWVRYVSPNSDGRIRVGDVRKAAGLWSPESYILPQDFSTNSQIFIMNHALKNTILQNMENHSSGLIVIKGQPGSGKSHFLNWLANAPPKHTAHVFLHHCFVSLEDETAWNRLDAQESAMSLLGLISTKARAAIQSPENPEPTNLKNWLQEVAADANKKNQRVILVLDGLDHIVRERDLDEARKLLGWLPTPIPEGLWVVIGTQPIQNLFPNHLERCVNIELQMTGFDKPAVRDYLTAYSIHEPDEQTVNAAFLRSEGNPLYLYYLMESVKSNQYPITEDRVLKTPAYGGSIELYYRALWQNINPGTHADRQTTANARALLALAGWADFSLPVGDLDYFATRLGVNLVDISAAKVNIEHLLHGEHLRKNEIRIYHESLRRFVREQPDAEAFKRPSLTALLGWAKERADEDTRWSAEWELELQLGNPTPLISGINRTWVVEALNQHRSHRRLLVLIRLAVDTAAKEQDALAMFRIGWLIQYANSAVRDGRIEGDAITAHLRCRLRMGLSLPTLVEILNRPNQYSYDGLALLAKCVLEFDSEDTIDIIFKQLNNGSHEGYDALFVVLGTGSFEAERVVSFYRRNLESGYSAKQNRDGARDWRGRFKMYLEALAFSGQTDVLESLTTYVDLDDLDRAAVWDALARAHVRLGDKVGVKRVLESLPQLSPYLSVVSVIVGSLRESEFLDQPFFDKNLDKNGANYSDDGGWSEHHATILWKSVAWAENGRQTDLEIEQARFSAMGFHGGFLSHLIRIGVAFYNAIHQHDFFDIKTFAYDLGSLKFPPYPSDDEYYPYKAGTEQWLNYLTQMLELLAFVGQTQSINVEQVRSLWANSRLGFPKILTWLEQIESSWINEMDRVQVVSDLEYVVVNVLDSFRDRALWFAQLANVSAALGVMERCEPLLRLSCENLMGHDYHKDMVLFSVIKSIRAAHLAGYSHAESDLISLAPMIHNIGDLTDGDETSSLYEELAEALQEINSPYATKLVASFLKNRDYQRHDATITNYLEQQPLDDLFVYALAKTFVSIDGARSAKSFFERRIAKFNLENSPEGANAELDFQHWFNVECPPDAREPVSKRNDDNISSEQNQIDCPTILTAKELIAWIKSQTDLESVKTEFSEILTMWQLSSVPITRAQAVDIAKPWLQLANGHAWLRGEMFDKLFHLLWRTNAKDLAFDALTTAQGINSDWSIYYTRQETGDTRLTTVIQNFPLRLTEYVIKSSLFGAQYGFLLYMPRVIDALTRGGKTELAFEITTAFVEFGRSLAAGLEMSMPEWSQENTPIPTTIDLMLERLRHVQLAVRTSTAKALAELIVKHNGTNVLEKLIEWLSNEPLNSYRSGCLLAILLAAKTSPGLVVGHLVAIRAALAMPTIPECLIFNDLLDLCSSSAPRLKPEIKRANPPVNSLFPDWYTKYLASWPVFLDRLKKLRSQVPNCDLNFFQECIHLGLSSDVVTEGNNLRRRYSNYGNRNSFGFIQDYSRDIFESAWDEVVTEAWQSGQLNFMDAVAMTFLLYSIDGSISELKPQGRPDWLVSPDIENKKIMTWTSQADHSVIKKLINSSQDESAILALDFNQVASDGVTGWRTEVLAFAYHNDYILPEPEQVWSFLEEMRVYCNKITGVVLDHPKSFIAPELSEFEGSNILPLIGRLRIPNGTWEPLTNLPSVWIPFLESSLLGDIVPIDQFPLTYAVEEAPSQPIFKGRFWQDGVITEIYKNGAALANIGYWLTCDQVHLEDYLYFWGLSMSWVKKTTVAVQVEYRDEYKESTEFSIHNFIPKFRL